MKEINWEEISFGIITYAGGAKSEGLMAIGEAKKGNFKKAHELLEQAEQEIIEAEKQHMEVIQQEAQGVKHQIPVLFMHAEDQMMTSQMVVELAKEFVDLYENGLEKRG